MVRLSMLTHLLLCVVAPSNMALAQSTKEVEVNGVHLRYVEQGSGEPIVFVHGGLGDQRSWEPVAEEVAKKYRFVAVTLRYYGASPWKDDGRRFSVATHADDLEKVMSSLNAGPVHLVGYSYGGAVATTAALKNPSLVRSLTVYEPALVSVLPAESEEGKAAREDRTKFTGSAITAAETGDFNQAARLFIEGVFQLPPGGFDRLPQATQTRVLENARVTPLMLAAIQQHTMTCDMLRNFNRPTLVMRGEKTQSYYLLINSAVGKCLPNAQEVVLQNVNHNGPVRDPAAFTASLLEFLSQR
jgi:pimeloyl-ACP methyl ester carboxylesterase